MYDLKNKVLKPGNYNLGISHGIPSIIIVLSKLLHLGIQPLRCTNMINRACNFILKCQLDNTGEDIYKVKSIYPYETNDLPVSTNISSRLAWCYGDLGIASSFWQAGNAIKNNYLKQEAINIMMHASNRISLKENGVVDSCICHGTAGIAHVFNRFYWNTKIPIFKKTADYWIDQTLKMGAFEDGILTYRMFKGEEQSLVSEYGFLEGMAGVGLSLISHIVATEPKWDNCLLLS
jgi:lantibiotic modifying enzyme